MSIIEFVVATCYHLAYYLPVTYHLIPAPYRKESYRLCVLLWSSSRSRLEARQTLCIPPII